MAKARGVRSQACDTYGQRVTRGDKRCREPRGQKHPQISPSDEIGCRERSGSTDARYEETITRSVSVAVRLTGK
jgi:hypothetical protein